MTYEEYEKLCKQQHERNEEYLSMFKRDLIQSGLAQKTIRKHLVDSQVLNVGVNSLSVLRQVMRLDRDYRREFLCF